MTMTTKQSFTPFRLEPEFNHRIWGKQSLAPWYSETGTTDAVGEAWLTAPTSRVGNGPYAGETLAETVGDFPLLVKMLFPNDKLSVQVHPNDAEAQELGQHRGKTECWYVLEAEPGATAALGLKPGVTLDALRASAEDGTMESLVEMVPVAVGDMIYVDAGTVHAIGPGMVLLEVQQTCDITYRLYDYGRPRELHLEKGLAVTKLKTGAGKIQPLPMDGFVRLIEARYFVVDRFETNTPTVVPFAGIGCLVGLSGKGTVRGEDGATIDLLPGLAVVCPVGDVTVRGDAVGFVRCVAPE